MVNDRRLSGGGPEHGPVVETPSGRVAGTLERPGGGDAAVRVFRGIPYAKAPSGERRFRRPETLEPWAGVLDARSFGPSAPQGTSGPYAGFLPCNRVAETSEDCLTLNVWSPPDGEALPVILWIHGGAYLTGGTSIETYDGGRLASEQHVVVVSVNYRLGALGFLWLGDHGGDRFGADANCGLLDQLAAYRWVQANIAAFGGDSGNVTLFGESAGAGSIVHLITSAVPHGIRRVICQSPGLDFTLTPERAAAVTDELLGELGLGRGDAAQLRQVPVEVLVAAQEAMVLRVLRPLSSMPLHPVLDGELVAAKPAAAIAQGQGAAVELLLTWTADELRGFPERRADEVDRGELVGWVRRYLSLRSAAPVPPDRAERLVGCYEAALAARGRRSGADVWAAIQTDGVMRLPARRFADEHALHGGRTFTAEFAWEAEGGRSWRPGAFHAIDLPFVFGTLDRGDWRRFLGADGAADRLSERIRRSWADFARRGEPGPVGGEDWLAYSATARSTMRLGEVCGVVDDVLAEVAEAWEGLWSVEGEAGASAIPEPTGPPGTARTGGSSRAAGVTGLAPRARARPGRPPAPRD